MRSYVALFALAMLLAGCRTETLTFDRTHPLVELVNDGVLFNGKYVKPQDVPDLLEERNVPRDQVIYIRINRLDHLQETILFRGLLANAGYRKSVLVSKEIAESWSQPPEKPTINKPAAKGRPTGAQQNVKGGRAKR